MRRSQMRCALVAAVFAALVGAPAGHAWTWPADGSVLRGFSFGDDPYAGGQHRGIDVGGRLGSSVWAPHAGSISFAGTVPTNGLTVTIQTDGGLSVTLVHLGSAAVRKGATVAEGDVVGTQGVFNMSAANHNGMDERARVLVTVRDGKFRLLPE